MKTLTNILLILTLITACNSETQMKEVVEPTFTEN